MVVAWPYNTHLISNEVYSLIPLSKIPDLEADHLSLHISSDTDLKTPRFLIMISFYLSPMAWMPSCDLPCLATFIYV